MALTRPTRFCYHSLSVCDHSLLQFSICTVTFCLCSIFVTSYDTYSRVSIAYLCICIPCLCAILANGKTYMINNTRPITEHCGTPNSKNMFSNRASSTDTPCDRVGPMMSKATGKSSKTRIAAFLMSIAIRILSFIHRSAVSVLGPFVYANYIFSSSPFICK